MEKAVTYIVSFWFCAFSYAQKEMPQKLAAVDSISIARADNAIKKVLGTESEDRTCLVFSIDDKVLLIHKTCGVYKIYAFIEVFDYDVQKKVLNERKSQKLKRNKLLDSVFNTSICKKQFTYSVTDSLAHKYAHWDTRYIYFMVSKNGRKTCEFNLPMSYKVDVSDMELIPIDQDVLNFLIERLIIMTK